jgi:hypothetical protein
MNGDRPPIGAPSSDIIPPDNAKDPILILILALFLGGIAYFVIGQWQKALVAIALWICGFVFVVMTCGIGSVLFFPVAIAIVVDAYMQADALKSGHPIGQWTFFGSHA